LHFTIVGSLGTGYWFLERWYQYWYRFDIYCSAILFIFALLLIAGTTLLRHLKGLALSRVMMVLSLILLCLPWGEWLRLALPEAREPWARQIFLQTAFLYAISVLISWIPEKTNKLNIILFNLVAGISKRPFLLWVPCFVFFAASASIALLILKKVPQIEDVASYLFQAKIFSGFHLYAPSPPVSEFFDIRGDSLVMHNGKWFGMYLPGFSMMLAPAMWINAEWFVSPFLGALTLWIWIRYVVRWHCKEVAVVFAIIYMLSPFLLLMSATVMIHTPELFIASSVLYLCRSLSERSQKREVFLLFAATTAVFLIRPFTLLIFLLPAYVYLALSCIRNRSLIPIVMAVPAVFFGFSLLSLYQWATTGNPLTPAYLLEIPNYSLGFGESLYHQVHTPARGLENVSNLLLGLNNWLTRWNTGSLFFVIVFFLNGTACTSWDRILLLCCVCLGIFHFFFVAQDLLYGPRFFYLFSPILILCIARSTIFEPAVAHKDTATFSTIAIVISILPALFWNVPQLLFQHTPDTRLFDQIRNSGSEKTIVFLQQKHQYSVNWNDPFLREPVILCLDRKDNQDAIEHFSAYRPVYYRPVLQMDKLAIQGGYSFLDKPSDGIHGYTSLFQVGLLLESAKDYPEKDIFDLTYKGFFQQEAALHRDYLLNLMSQTDQTSDYRKHFQKGLVLTGLMLTNPLVSFEKDPVAWRSRFNPAEFRESLESAKGALLNSGEVGLTSVKQFEKIQARIDGNRDSILSDEEILYFISLKIRLLEKY